MRLMCAFMKSQISGAFIALPRDRWMAPGLRFLGALVAATGVALIAAPSAFAARQGDESRSAAAEIDGVQRGTLPNGLAYFIDPAKRSDGKILFRLLLPVGEKETLPREQSVAHVVEHIVFGSAHVADRKGPMRTRIERFGGSLGNDANASVGTASSGYFVKLPAGRGDALDAGIDFLYDWMAPRMLSDEEIDREIQAVIEERRRGATDATLDRSAAQHKAWFPGHPHYDFRPDRLGILSATPVGVRSLYSQWYTPPNMAVIIAGEVDPDAVLAAITAKLGPIPRGQSAPPHADPGLLALDGGHYVPLATDGPSESRIELTFKYRPAPNGSAERAREKAIGLIVNHAAASLLPALSERYDAPNKGIGLQFESLYPYPGINMLRLESATRSGATRDGLGEMLRLAATLRRDGFSAESIERARAAAIASLADTQIDRAGRLDTIFLEGAADPTPQEISAAAVNVSAADVNAQLAAWLDPAHRDVFVFHPRLTAPTVPSASDFAAIDRAAERAPSVQLALPALRNPAFVPFVPATVPARSGIAAGGGYLRWTLPRSGATLLVRRSDTREAKLEMRRRGGLARVDPADAPVLALADEVVGRSGLAALDIFEFGRFVIANNIAVRPRITPEREGLTASAPVEQWTTLLQLARASILQPLCRTEAFDEVRERRLDTASVEAEFLEAAAFQAMISKSLGALSTAIEPDRLRALDAAEVCTLYARLPSDTADMVVAVEADLDPVLVYQTVAATLDLPRQGQLSVTRVRRAPAGAPERRVDATRAGRDVLRIGALPSAKVEMISRRPKGGDERAGDIVAIILSQRLNARLRTAEKGTYDASVSFFADDAILSIAFDTGPDKVERMIAATKDELARMRRDGATAEEIAAARGLVREEPLTASFAAETWLKRASFDPPPPVSDAAIAAWITRAIDPAQFREFVRLPKT